MGEQLVSMLRKGTRIGFCLQRATWQSAASQVLLVWAPDSKSLFKPHNTINFYHLILFPSINISPPNSVTSTSIVPVSLDKT